MSSRVTSHVTQISIASLLQENWPKKDRRHKTAIGSHLLPILSPHNQLLYFPDIIVLHLSLLVVSSANEK